MSSFDRFRGRLCLLPVLLVWTACGETLLPPFGDLATPVAVAVHQQSKQAFIASQGGDELRVFDLQKKQFLIAPAISFPLSIPTVPTPRLLAAGERFVFVVSGADGSVGFVDTEVPPGAFGPRSVNDEAGAPVVARPPLLPTAAVAMAVPLPGEAGAGDHLIVAGLDPSGEGGRLSVVRPPLAGEAPRVVGDLALPGLHPVGLALERGEVVAPGQGPDCRHLAIADSNQEAGHVPGIWLTQVEVGVDGAVAVRPLDPAEKIEVEVEVTLADGSTEVRTAPVRTVAFAPVPRDVHLDEAVEGDPCVQRSGRLFAILAPTYCEGAITCPNFAAIDLPSKELARDGVRGAPAVYQLPAVPLEMVSLEGPILVRGNPDERRPAPTTEIVAGDPPTLQSVPAGLVDGLTLVTSSDGGVTYVAGGFGPRLLGPSSTRRRGSDPVFLLDADPALPGLEGAIRRIDRRGQSLPRLDFPVAAQPKSEQWTAGFEIPLPGFEAVGVVEALQGATFVLPQGKSALGPVPLLASADPFLADRLVPQAPGARCEGFPLVSIGGDGRTLTVDRAAPGFVNDEACLAGSRPVSILPPVALPWTLAGSTSGFVGRLPADPDRSTSVAEGSRLLFLFQPPQEAVERGATFTWNTTSGFAFFRQQRDDLLLPASIASLQRETPSRNLVVVAYSGSNAIAVYDPVRIPTSSETFIFR